jgi:hypothetical protein
MKKLCDVREGTRVFIPLNTFDQFIFTFDIPSKGCDVIPIKHCPDWGTYIGWEEGKTPSNMPLSYQIAISDEDRKKYNIDQKYKYGFKIDSKVEIRPVKSIKSSSAGFLLACIGAGASISALSQSMLSNDQKGLEESETIRN